MKAGLTSSERLPSLTAQIEHMGLVSSIVPLDETESGGGGWSMTISDSAQILDDCHVGDSIAVNGTCLTVTEHNKDAFKIGLAPETLEKTDLGRMSSPMSPMTCSKLTG